MDSLYKKLELLLEVLKKAKEEKPAKSKSITVGANDVKITAPGIKPKTSEPKPEKQIKGRQANEFEVHANVDHLFDKGEMCKFLPNGQWSLEKANSSPYNAGMHPMKGRPERAKMSGSTYEFDHDSDYDTNFKAAKEHYKNLGMDLADDKIHNVLRSQQKKKS